MLEILDWLLNALLACCSEFNMKSSYDAFSNVPVLPLGVSKRKTYFLVIVCLPNFFVPTQKAVSNSSEFVTMPQMRLRGTKLACVRNNLTSTELNRKALRVERPCEAVNGRRFCLGDGDVTAGPAPEVNICTLRHNTVQHNT